MSRRCFIELIVFAAVLSLFEIVGLSLGGNLAAAFGTDNTIIYLEPGEYTGDFEVTAEGVLIFVVGTPTEGSLSTIRETYLSKEVMPG